MQGPSQLAALALFLGLGTNLSQAAGPLPPTRGLSSNRVLAPSRTFPLPGHGATLPGLGVNVRVPPRGQAVPPQGAGASGGDVSGAPHQGPGTSAGKLPAVPGQPGAAGRSTPLGNAAAAPPGNVNPLTRSRATSPPTDRNASRQQGQPKADSQPNQRKPKARPAQVKPDGRPAPAQRHPQRKPENPAGGASPLNRAGAANPPASPSRNTAGPGDTDQRIKYTEGMRKTLFGGSKPRDQMSPAEKKFDGLTRSYIDMADEKRAAVLMSNLDDMMVAFESQIQGKASPETKESLLMASFNFMDRFL